MLTLKIRYKKPAENESRLLEVPLVDEDKSYKSASDDFRFASAVAAFGMLLRHSSFSGSATFESIADWAEGALGEDRDGYRREFIDLVLKAKQLAPTVSEVSQR